MLVDVSCKKCGQSAKLDIGDMTKKEVEDFLKRNDGGFQCFGNHVELGTRDTYWTVDWDSIKEGSAMSEDDFVKEMRETYLEVYDSEQFTELFDIKGFQYALCVAVRKSNGEELVFNYKHSPQGKRYYFKY